MASIYKISGVKWLLTPAKPSILGIIIWWEIRRIPYNILMLIIGIVGLVLVMLMMELSTSEFPPSPEDDFVPLIAVMGAATIANICYTGGWIVEIFARLRWKEKASHFGPIMWSVGMVFSTVVCFLPGLLHLLLWLACLMMK